MIAPGNPDPLSPHALVERFLSLVPRIARKLRSRVRRLDWEEMLSEGNLALVSASRAYDRRRCPNGGLDGALRCFGSYAARHIWRAIVKAEMRRQQTDLPLLADPELAGDDEPGHQDNLEAVSLALRQLADPDGPILGMTYGVGGYRLRSRGEIAAACRLSQQEVEARLAAALVELRLQVQALDLDLRK